jgi:hypothetical protein
MTEDNDVKSETDCMDQKKDEPQKALPAPEEKKRQILNLSIDVEDLFTKIPQIVTPENQRVWASHKEMSEGYIKLNQHLQVLAMYIARSCNEGPEVKDNINKRVILARTVLGMIVDNLAITGYDAYGMLVEMQQDLFMKVDGKKHIINTLAQVEQAKAEIAQEKAHSYTS